MDRLDPHTTALVLIDLQGGILQFAKGPYNGDQVLATSGALARQFRAAGALVVLVRIGHVFLGECAQAGRKDERRIILESVRYAPVAQLD